MEVRSVPDLKAALASPFFAASPDGIVVVDGAGVIVAANDQAQELLGYAPGELVGRAVEDLVPARLRPAHTAHRATYLSHPRPRAMGAGLRLFALRQDGSSIPVDIALSPIAAGDQQYTIAAVRDATARLEAEIAIAEAEEWRAIIDDRQRIARDLHDTVIQDIFAAGMGLQALQRRMADDAAKEQLGASVSHLDSVITRLRKVIFNLTHGDEEESLEAAAHRVVADGIEGTDLTLDIAVKAHEQRLPARTQEHVLATLQEAVSNIVRHASASALSVLIDATDGMCRLCVTDNGTGIPDAAASRPGFGLTNMMNRAQVLGGSCEIKPSNDGGTVVDWKVPL